MNYYNEIDPYAAQWLRHLIMWGYIAYGEVDERSIVDVHPSDLRGYVQCHFFAGIGVWSYALKRAGWVDDRPVWTGSCPCQPFSAAGKRGGTTDERHLWPAWEYLIARAKPRGVPVFGEQVASKDGLAWFDLVHADLEGQGYTVRAADLCAAGVGAPHIRQRLFFVADADTRSERLESGSSESVCARRTEHNAQSGFRRRGADGELADAERNPGGARRAAGEPAEGAGAAPAGAPSQSGRRGLSRDVGHADDAGPQGRGVSGAVASGHGACERAAGAAGAVDGMGNADGEQQGSVGGIQQGTGTEFAGMRPTAGFWHPADWLPCIDGKARPVEPGTFPLAHGVAARVGRLRAYGNAIVAPLAEEFIRAYMSGQ